MAKAQSGRNTVWNQLLRYRICGYHTGYDTQIPLQVPEGVSPESIQVARAGLGVFHESQTCLHSVYEEFRTYTG